jgi:two-component system OmpR family sensor kinase
LNELEKRSFYSFVALYLGSSALFILLLGYWYYSAQKNSLESTTYYKLNHIADKLSGLIINAQMKHKTLHLPNEEGFEYSLISTDERSAYKAGYYAKEGYKVLVSDAPQEHLGIEYVVVRTKEYFEKLHTLKVQVLTVMGISFIFIGFISFLLSKLFLKPLHNRMMQIESFIQDVSHELNTPITALGMSASRAMKKEVYDKKILQNISISTKQLESIYKSLTYLNFKQKSEEPQRVNLKDILTQVIAYYKELTDAKKITIVSQMEDVEFLIVPARAELLFSNLLSNAIKYSMPETTITITLTQESFVIEDEGVGIEDKKLREIFEMYKRNSDIAGGFGVGLGIVKQICDEYGIGVDVSSKIGKGSRFTLSLP